MKWKKLGIILKPLKFEWMVTHAAKPCAEHLYDGVYRVYFSGRDKQNRSRGGFFDIDIKDPKKFFFVPKEPILDIGNLGCFDDSGVMPSSVVLYEGKKYMYYTGWSIGVTVPFYLNIGLATSSVDETVHFERYSLAPIIGKNFYDPYLTAAPCVMVKNGIWKMWYSSGTGWKIEGGRPKHYYHIRYAESINGLEWTNDGTVCIDYQSPSEYAIASPSVLYEDCIYKMWYCYRSDRYRIGYAESSDGVSWYRLDHEAGIDASPSGWDSEMVCYPFVISHEGKKYMFYNGNSYGKTGLGLAVLE